MSRKLPNSFRKAERLCSHESLEQLYATGESMLVYPLRCVYRWVECVDEPLRIMITVPKKNHRRAVHRNLLKRRIRESYRLNRSLYFDTHQECMITNLQESSAAAILQESSAAATSLEPYSAKPCAVVSPVMALEFAVSYIAKEILDYQIIESAVQKILKKLGHRSADLTN